MTATDRGHVQVWETNSKRCVLSVASTFPTAAVFSLDGRAIFVGANDGVVRSWEVASGRPLGELRGPKETRVLAIRHRDQGNTVSILSSSGELTEWDARDARQIAVGRVAPAETLTGALSPAGDLVFAECGERSLG